MNARRSTRHLAHAVTGTLLVTGLLVSTQASAQEQWRSGVIRHDSSHDQKGSTNVLVRTVRDATERFRDVAVAEAEGYSLLFGCVSGPDSGAMGLHYVNLPLVGDGVLDPTRPEIVIYEPLPDGRLKLTGADFLVFAADWHAKQRRHAAAHGPVAAPVREPESLRPAGLLHAARVGVEAEPDRHVRELARQRVVRGLPSHALKPSARDANGPRAYCASDLSASW